MTAFGVIVAAFVLLRWVWKRRRRTVARRDLLATTREDRSAWRSRMPGRPARADGRP